ncbi:mucin-2-like [Centropristis striata]|uniref:mucin-2-like n=1 Tax=Centropristis striata TaxID=184440 RepID=UPI0027E03F67|nr:mucin-2-like [Centropristis striata]
MELPLGGPALRHYTQSRPRPHRQKLNHRPSRQQETIIENDDEVLELMGRVDEGVEEFFTKRVLPADTLKTQDEEAITVHSEVSPASSAPCPAPTRTLRRKLGDFFTLKKRRGLKSEGSQEGRAKKTSIADLIRPLREVARAEKDKDKERVKEQDKENEKEKGKELTGEPAGQEAPGAPLRGEAAPPRRALREGKSQSLILLSGSAAGTTNARNTSKKQFEGQHSFEQKLHLMLQRIGVSKAQPGDSQNQEGEMKKAESEGTIIDSKPEPPPTFTKPRTMSASSDTRHQMRPSVSAHESAGKPALLPKPVIKPGAPPTTSGRNTPENELAQILEGDASTPTKQSPAAAPAPTTSTTTPTAPTISGSAPDSAQDPAPDSAPDSAQVSSTEAASDSQRCTDSVTSTAPTPADVTELHSKPSVSEANATSADQPTSTSTSPTEPPTTAPPPAASCDSVTPSLSVTSSSAAITSVTTTSQTLSAASHESSASTTPTAPSVSETPPGVGAATSSSVSETADDLTPAASTCSETLVSSVCGTTPPPPDPATDVSAPSTSSSETNPTDTTSTASSLKRADTTSTSSSATATAICSPLLADSDAPFTYSVSSVSSSLPSAPDQSSAPSDPLTGPAPSRDAPGPEPDGQTPPEERSAAEPAEKTTAADEEPETVKSSEQTEIEESSRVSDSQTEKEKPALSSNSEVRMTGSEKPEEDSMKPEEEPAEPGSGREEPCSTQGEVEGQKQEEEEE